MTGSRPDVDALPEDKNQRIFETQIIPTLHVGTPQPYPVLVIVAGQTGAGKTGLTALIRHALPSHVLINMDDYNPRHPRYTGWLREDPAGAAERVRTDGQKWWSKAQQFARRHRQHVVLESAARYPSEFEEIAAEFTASGYRVEAAVMATPPLWSRLGILSRYVAEVDAVGWGRRVPVDVHDECCAGVLRGAAAVDGGGLAHAAYAFRRGGRVLYANQVNTADHRWSEPAAFAAAVRAEHARPWTQQERRWFDGQLARLRSTAPGEIAAELDNLAAAAGRYGPSVPARLAGPAFPPATGAPVVQPAAGAGDIAHPLNRGLRR